MPALFDCPELDCWQALFDDAVAPSQREAYEHHLECCRACQERIHRAEDNRDELLAMVRRLAGAATEPPDPTLDGFLERLRGVKSLLHPMEPADLAFLRPAHRPGLLGILGAYEVLEVIGQGGMGIVLKAFDPSLQRLVAVKVMAPCLASSANARRRFTREARSAAAVCHKHVVKVHDVLEEAGLPYLVMEYVEGESLQSRIDGKKLLEIAEIVGIGLQTAQGLAAAHAQGLIHRDIKPANLLLAGIGDAPDGTYGTDGTYPSHRSHPSRKSHDFLVKITDFGLARMVDDVRLTQIGVVAGTPEYMAPEQARGESVDHRADLFSLGSVLYALCTGAPPFRGSSTVAVLRQVSDDEPAAIRSLNPDVPQWLETLIVRLMAKEPADRFQSAAEAAVLLERHLARMRETAMVRDSEHLSPSVGGCLEVPKSGLLARFVNLIPQRQWLAAGFLVLAVLAVLALGIAFRTVGAAGETDPKKASPQEVYLPLKGKLEEMPGLALFGREAQEYVHFEPTGLRIKLPLGYEGRRLWNGVKLGVVGGGDFEIGVSFEILQAPRPADAGNATRFTLDVGLDRSKDEKVCLSWRAQSGGVARYRTLVTWWDQASGKSQPRGDGFPVKEKKGRFRLVRAGSDVSYYLARGDSSEFTLLARYPAGTQDIEDIRIVALTGGPKAALDVRFTDLRIRTQSFGTLPANADEVTAWEENGWAAAVLILAVTILFAAAGVWLYMVRFARAAGPSAPATLPDEQNKSSDAAPMISFSCSGCAKTLKAKPDLAGRKVRCPKCGESVRVPEAAPAVPGKKNRSTMRSWLIALLGLGFFCLVPVFVLVVVKGRSSLAALPATPSFMDVTLGNRLIAGVEESGFYHDERNSEGPFRWTNGNARLEIPLVKDQHPKALYVQLVRPVKSWLQIKINNQELVNEKATDRPLAWWDKTIDLSGVELGDKLVVEIVSNNIAPQKANLGKNKDSRSLGVRVRQIKLLSSANSDNSSSARTRFLNVTPGEPSIPGVVESGFHFEERDRLGLFRWTNGKGKLVIPVDKTQAPNALLIQLDRPKNSFLRITVNDRVLVNEPADEQAPQWWERTVALNGIDLGEKLVVMIESNSSVPKKDTRVIGVQVRAVKLIVP